MSFRKAIEAGKEPRRKRGIRFSPGCQHNGSCNSCRDNRLYRVNKRLEDSKDQMKSIEIQLRNYDKLATRSHGDSYQSND